MDKLQLFIIIRHTLEGAHNPLELPQISFDRMCLPQIQPCHSRTNACILWGKPACDRSLEFCPRHFTFLKLLILDIFHPPRQHILNPQPCRLLHLLMFLHGHCPKEIFHLPQPSSNVLVVTIPLKGFWWWYLDWQPFYYLGPGST